MSSVDQIKSRIDILSLVTSYIKLERAGASWKGKCPFHNEKSPSFFVSPERGSYYCFGCGASGDIFTFVEEFEGLDFKGALKLLADKAGVPLEVYSREHQKAVSEKEDEKERLYLVMEEATKFFENNFPPKADQPQAEKEIKDAWEYLKSRGILDKTIKDFRIGYAILDWRKLYDYLKSKNFTDSDMEKAGLAKRPEAELGAPNKAMYDRFRGRIMFPISDSSGRVIAFSGRILSDDGKSAKYLNSPETLIFKKSAVLYGLDKAKQSIRKNDFSIVVEGQFDLILSHQAGFRNTVATSGTALVSSEKSENNSVNNLGLISRLSQNIIFIFDGDMAGFNASMRATPIALALFSDMNVKATEIPEGMDPADLISKKGPDAWREVIRNSKHIIEFLVDKHMSISKDNKDKLKTKLEIENKIIPYLALIKNPVKRSHFVSLIFNKSGISENDIRDRLKTVEKELKSENKGIEEMVGKKERIFRKDYILRKLLGIIFWQKTLKEKKIDTDQVLKEIAEIFNKMPEEVLTGIKENKEDLIFEAEVFYGEGAFIEKDVTELLFNLREEYLKEELSHKIKELHLYEENKNTEKVAEVLKEVNAINNKIQNIKNSRLSK